MLADMPVAASIAVSDLARARNFYENVLGLASVQEMPGGVVYTSGGSAMLVYESEYAGTNQATTATWSVGGDFDEIVQALQSKGVTFEHYDDLPEVTRNGDVHRAGDMKLAWFKDPDGNIHHLISE